jgi:hypothetical protein
MATNKLADLFSTGSSEENNKTGLEYLNGEGLFNEEVLTTQKETNAIPPQYSDLARLHYLIRSRKVFSIMEFGLGWSTLVMADALKKNHEDWEALTDKPSISGDAKFQLVCVDTSEYWINHTKEKVSAALRDYITFYHSNVIIGTFQDRICHYYETLPDITPDFIYLDGPDPTAVQGSLSGITFSKTSRIVISADILKIEPILLPGAMFLVDGRTANVRFLTQHLYRNWQINSNTTGDITTFELAEPPLGKRQAAILEYQLGQYKPRN